MEEKWGRGRGRRKGIRGSEAILLCRRRAKATNNKFCRVLYVIEHPYPVIMVLLLLEYKTITSGYNRMIGIEY